MYFQVFKSEHITMPSIKQSGSLSSLADRQGMFICCIKALFGYDEERFILIDYNIFYIDSRIVFKWSYYIV